MSFELLIGLFILSLGTVAAICDLCRAQLTYGDEFLHCKKCRGNFDVCIKCYAPNVHENHVRDLRRGTFPEFNPYGVPVMSAEELNGAGMYMVHGMVHCRERLLLDWIGNQPTRCSFMP